MTSLSSPPRFIFLFLFYSYLFLMEGRVIVKLLHAYDLPVPAGTVLVSDNLQH